MIVKNEARVIGRCLDSARPFIDSWVIVDTGSTDATKDIIRRHLSDLPGELHDRPWRDFAHNRNEALDLALNLALGKADYVLFIDADEEFVVPAGFRLPTLTADAYQLRHRVGADNSYYRTQLVRSSLPYRYAGVMHEVLVCAQPHAIAKLDGLEIRDHFDSARNADPKAKYEADAAALERALETEPENARHVFYLAQSYRDCGRLTDALAAYRRRAGMGGWHEEVWYALYQIGLIEERTGSEFPRLLAAYLAAHQYRPERAEALCQLARVCRLKGDHSLGYLFARQAAETDEPDDLLFLDNSVYGWRALDELSIAEYWTGRHAASAANCRKLLSGGKLPANERRRLIDNLNFALRAVGEPEYSEETPSEGVER